MGFFDEREQRQLHLMAIALIQEGLGQLDLQTETQLAVFEQNGRGWREHLIYKLNGFDLPPEFIIGAIKKKWLDEPKPDVEAFTRKILSEWGVC